MNKIQQTIKDAWKEADKYGHHFYTVDSYDIKRIIRYVKLLERKNKALKQKDIKQCQN